MNHRISLSMKEAEAILHSSPNAMAQMSRYIMNTEGNMLTQLTNMGEKINSKGIELCPIVTPDGKYLFYMRRDCVMWVSAKFIEELKPMEMK